jgi:hypothetical protein
VFNSGTFPSGALALIQEKSSGIFFLDLLLASNLIQMVWKMLLLSCEDLMEELTQLMNSN